MPDRLPPHWGHEPEDGRGLDASLSVEEILTDEALLAGQFAGIPDSQRPVAGAMLALRAAPAESEVAGEAAARAAFRALIGPAGAEPHHTLVLPVPAQGQVPRPASRHRRRRRAGGSRGGWQVKATLGAAAAVVVIGATALAGTLSGSAGHGGQSANPNATQQSTLPGASPTPTQRVLGGGQATTDPTSSVTPTASAAPGATPSQGSSQSGADLCRQYYFPGRHSHGDGKKNKELFEELSRLAGSPANISAYCEPLLAPYTATPEPTSSMPGLPYSGSEAGKGRPDSGGSQQ